MQPPHICLCRASLVSSMYVIKRDGKHEPVQFDKIRERLAALTTDLPEVDVALVATKVIQGMVCGIKTEELDVLAAETGACWLHV
jgi:hypothetical protein